MTEKTDNSRVMRTATNAADRTVSWSAAKRDYGQRAAAYTKVPSAHQEHPSFRPTNKDPKRR